MQIFIECASESIYDIYNETTQLDIGQLEADYEMLCKS